MIQHKLKKSQQQRNVGSTNTQNKKQKGRNNHLSKGNKKNHETVLNPAIDNCIYEYKVGHKDAEMNRHLKIAIGLILTIPYIWYYLGVL